MIFLGKKDNWWLKRGLGNVKHEGRKENSVGMLTLKAEKISLEVEAEDKKNCRTEGKRKKDCITEHV